MPRYLARCADDLPSSPAGVLGTFAVTVPTGTTTVAGDAFTRCEGLAQVTLLATVTVIADGGEDDDGEEEHGAFLGCASLRAIALPPTLTVIGVNAFQECTPMAAITLPPSLTNIRELAFFRCTSLTEITLPPNLTKFGEGGLRRVHVLDRDLAAVQPH